MYKPAILARGIITDCDGQNARRYYRAAGQFVVHKSFVRGWTVSLRNGAALGAQYWNRECAERAAEAMAPLVKNWTGLDLDSVFGHPATSREAYDRAISANNLDL